MKREIKEYAEDAVRETGGGCMAFVLLLGVIAFIACLAVASILALFGINEIITSIL